METGRGLQVEFRNAFGFEDGEGVGGGEGEEEDGGWLGLGGEWPRP